MDLNYVLRWIVGVSTVAGIVRLLRANSPTRTGWIVVFFLVLALLGCGMLLFPEVDGYVAGIFWLIFILGPSLLFRRVQKELFKQRFSSARRIAMVARYLHPADGIKEYPDLIRSFELARLGKFDEAEGLLLKYQSTPGWVGQSAGLYLKRLRGDWPGILNWCAAIPPAALARSADTLTMYLRALGEEGRLNEMVEMYRKFQKQLTSMQKSMRDLARLYVYSFAGKTAVVEKLFDGSLSLYPRDIRDSWIGTSMLAAGNLEEGRRCLETLMKTADPITCKAVEQRLAHPVLNAAQTLIPPSAKILQEDEQVFEHEARYEPASQNRAKPLLTYSLIAASAIVFIAEMVLGGSSNQDTLWRLGAMRTSLVLYGEWWRVFAAQFLHYGPVHLGMNMLALYMLGPFVERELGRVRYLVLYLVSGTCAMLTIIFLTMYRLIPDGFVVGASGNILGLIGGSAAILLYSWIRHRAASARRRLGSIALILALQTGFDLMTPQVSLTAHLSGALFGFLIALLMLIIWPSARARN